MRDLKIPDQRHPEKAHRPDNAQPKKPDWIRVKAPSGKGYQDTSRIIRDNKLVTVCEEAGCPNVGECWSQGHATMMIMGEICTRGCTFCNVATGKPKATAVADDPLVRGVSPSEAALLRRLGADEVGPNIRQVVERETTAIELESKNFVEDLMFWKNKEPPAKVVDADAERRRIQGNAALGKDTTSGLTPDISRKKSGGLLHNLF